MSIDDKPRSGRSSTARTDEKVEKIRELVLTDRRQTLDQLTEISGISWSSIQRILTQDLGMKRITAKFVPRALTDNQKECRVETCRDLKEQLKTDPDFLSKVMNHGAMVMTQRQNNSPPNGRCHRHPDQKNVAKSNRTSKQC